MRALVAITCALSVGASMTAGTAPKFRTPDGRDHGGVLPVVVLGRFLHSGRPALSSYRARRALTASAMGGRVHASLDAWTCLDPDGTFRFDIIQHDGSGLIRERVLEAALKAEQRSRNRRETGHAEINAMNYGFQVDEPMREDGLVTIRLFPLRKSPLLLNGRVTVKQEDGDMVRIEGSPVKRPSWWTKHVRVVRRYQRIAGVRVPIEMSSQADVRLAGKATFSMIYDYEMINGQVIGAPIRSSTGVGCGATASAPEREPQTQ